MIFRKKPIAVEAEQWFNGKQIDGVVCNPIGNPMTSDCYYVNTHSGWAEVKNGDWIITQIDGEKYPCKPDLFTQTYEEAPITFDLGLAISLAKVGEKVARHNWNGRGMFVVYQKGYPQGIPSNKQTADAWGLNEGDLFVCNPYLQIRNPDGSHSMWAPSVGDALAEDWYIV